MPQPVSQGVDIDTPPGSGDWSKAQLMLNILAAKQFPMLIPLFAHQLQVESPSSGDEIQMAFPQRNSILQLNGDSTIAELTIKLLAEEDTWLGQERIINTAMDVTSLSFDTQGATILGVPDTLMEGNPIILRKIATNIWIANS